MAKASSSRRLNVDYLVLQCAAADGIVNLGVLGTVRLMPKMGMLFFVGNPPKKIDGLDPFEMKLVSAAPNAIREDLNQLTSQNISPDKLLDEVSRRYRGTVFASERTTKELPTSTNITSSTSMDQIFAQLMSGILKLAENEKITLQTKRRTGRRSAKATVRHRSVKATRRQISFPQQFEMTTVHI